MLEGDELSDLRIRVFGADVPAVSQTQLQALAAYRDKPFTPNPHGHPSCAYCQENAPMCELAAERLDDAESDRWAAESGHPEESDGTVLVKGDFICRRCLAAELPSLRQRLQEIHWIELSSMELGPASMVVTTGIELDVIQHVLERH